MCGFRNVEVGMSDGGGRVGYQMRQLFVAQHFTKSMTTNQKLGGNHFHAFWFETQDRFPQKGFNKPSCTLVHNIGMQPQKQHPSS